MNEITLRQFAEGIQQLLKEDQWVVYATLSRFGNDEVGEYITVGLTNTDKVFIVSVKERK